MIAPMKRAFLLMSEKERRDTAKKLRALGLVHLEPMSGSGDAYDALAADALMLEAALPFLAEYGPQKGEQELGYREAVEHAKRVLELEEEIRALNDRAGTISAEIERVRPWGSFDPSALAELSGLGVPIRLAAAPVKRLAALAEQLDFVTLSRVKGQAHLAVLAGAEYELPADVVEFRAPEASLDELQARLSATKKAIMDAKASIASRAVYEECMRHTLAGIHRDLQLETVRSGAPSDGGVLWYSGWVPAKSAHVLAEAAGKHGWAIILDDPLDDEQPPTKLENNAVVRMVQPIMDFMGTVPNYREYDISGWFLLFFGIFFAMIFGDAGYGSLMLGLVAMLALRSRAKSGRLADGYKLFMFLSGLTVLWGALSGNWFALGRDALPPFLQAIAIEPIASWNPASNENIKVLCFILGALQLAVAHIKNVLRDFPKPKFIGQLGSLALVLGMYYLVLNLVVSSAKFPVPSWGLYAILGGFSLSFLFGSWETGPIQSVLDSLKNIISLFLGTVSFFADIVSYIRLWAVGLAGVAIAQTVNGMASPLLRIPLAIVFGGLILVVGHGLNLAMGALSVVVHGMRLNLLEFSGHMGMEWSGYQYQPFKDAGDKPSA